jgi:hypothetical protein
MQLENRSLVLIGTLGRSKLAKEPGGGSKRPISQNLAERADQASAGVPTRHARVRAPQFIALAAAQDALVEACRLAAPASCR